MQEFFSTFSFRALWTPELIAVLAGVAFVYYWITVKRRDRFIGAEDVPLRQKVYFVLGLFALYLGWGSPLYIAGHSSMTIHMIQMVFAYFAAVPLFLLSIPKWVLHTFIYKWKKKANWSHTVIMNPVLGLLLFNGLFSVYHIPAVFDALMLNKPLHSVYYIVLLGAAGLMWWHMLAPLPSNHNLSDLRRIIYIFGNGILITPACALIIFAGSAMYETYTNPAVWSNVMAYCLPPGDTLPPGLVDSAGSSFRFLDVHPDQQLAGVLMKIAQEIVYMSTIGYVFKQWLSKESLQDGETTISDIPAHANHLKNR
ncbi:cytochrome c oxidase assembly factor CtaG [Alteribacillus iranensis]|uniref:Putative membrane protein n=1 Tax=Alteribacillus iranensis TaxID=930128 RepID=A0A1I2CYK4_9BACI|nr:cytochrome c oxidase assembly factor CtaG [Alteribacillus iranensis]SFE72820.1 putative membrane protein [Alteribacillus iranensis]